MHPRRNNHILVIGLTFYGAFADRISISCFVGAGFPRPGRIPIINFRVVTGEGGPRPYGYGLIFSRKLLVDPEKFLAFIQHADETAEAGVFGFEQGVEFAQGGVLGARTDAAFKVGGIDNV